MATGPSRPAGVHPLVAAALFVGIALFVGGIVRTAVDHRQARRAGWRVFALLYGVSEVGEGAEVPVAAEGHASGDPGEGGDCPATRPGELAWSAFLIKGQRRTVLFDTGFDDPAMARRWRVRGFRRVTSIVRTLGVDPEDVTDVVLSHLHWDHAGNVAPFTRARVWVRRAEYDWARSVVAPERFARHGVHWTDVEVLQSIERRGHLELLGDRGVEIAPGLRLHLGGLHSRGDQWLEVRVGGTVGTVVIVGDDAASFASLTREAADAARARLRARMAELAGGEDHVLMSHDIGIWSRFPEVADRVVEIR